jgi:uncharacterized protein (TIGR03083 family)
MDRKQAVIAEWDRQHEETVALLESLQAADFGRPTACEGWTVLDQATHLAAAAAVLPPQIERMRKREPNPGLAALEQRNVEGLASRKGRALPELIAEFRDAHARNRELLRKLPEDELDVEGALVTGEMISIEERFRRAGLHYLEHATYIRDALGR